MQYCLVPDLRCWWNRAAIPPVIRSFKAWKQSWLRTSVHEEAKFSTLQLLTKIILDIYYPLPSWQFYKCVDLECYLLYKSHTPNCNNIVVEKWKKNKGTFPGFSHSHLQPLHFPAGIFLLFFGFKTIANSNRPLWRPCVDAVNEFIRRISLINSYLAFSFLHFSKTMLLQLGV